MSFFREDKISFIAGAPWSLYIKLFILNIKKYEDSSLQLTKLQKHTCIDSGILDNRTLRSRAVGFFSKLPRPALEKLHWNLLLRDEDGLRLLARIRGPQRVHATCNNGYLLYNYFNKGVNLNYRIYKILKCTWKLRKLKFFIQSNLHEFLILFPSWIVTRVGRLKTSTHMWRSTKGGSREYLPW